ncbi:MAG TPA: VOC family protein [Candidatus Dormibacteraeota bacterium]|jgi:predicted enzyme related to lactoylglutathione lyase|nr:VOC family protein [Candidatus Dormibacteraeota bacterium]
MSGDLSYFWIPSPDPEKGGAFYSGLFGWTLEPRQQGDGYSITSTSVYGGIVGGREGTRPHLYFLVDDVPGAVEEIHELGGHAGEVSEFTEGASAECSYDGVEFGIFRPSGEMELSEGKQWSDLSYFTIPIGDAGDGRSFYAALFGWEYEHDDIDAPYHHIVNVTPPGGLFAEDDGTRPRSYFRVEDIEASMQRVRDLGGEVGMPIESVTGFSTDCSDDQGIEFSLWQPAEGY